ncbi:hypothetical protein [Rubritalea marina]|uniref:hypothetical protein n=1 Tax=Rubritalea marina TaxID=361055 RepID=UPI00036D569F|nr:hypothetical protein [Rubritalea marina]
MKLEDIIETQHPEPGLLWWELAGYAMLGLLVLAGFIFAGVVVSKHKRKAPSIYPADLARQALRQLDTEALSTAAFAKSASFILRDYFRARFEAPTLFQTLEEFKLSSEETSLLPDSVLADTTQFLTNSSAIIYNPRSHDAQEATTLQQLGLSIIDHCEAAPDRAATSEPKPNT